MARLKPTAGAGMPANNGPARAPILVVDGDQDDGAAVARLLRGAGFEAQEARTGEAALAAARASRPALVILDVQLPDMSGYEVCRALRDAFGDSLPIVFVSALRTESFDRVAGLLLGADDYIVEPFAHDELLARIRRLVSRSANGAVHVGPGLTKRELEVLQLLASGYGQREIAARLVIASKTVATHIQHILAKLGVHSRAEAVAAAHRLGLVRDSDVHLVQP